MAQYQLKALSEKDFIKSIKKTSTDVYLVNNEKKDN